MSKTPKNPPWPRGHFPFLSLNILFLLSSPPPPSQPTHTTSPHLAVSLFLSLSLFLSFTLPFAHTPCPNPITLSFSKLPSFYRPEKLENLFFFFGSSFPPGDQSWGITLPHVLLPSLQTLCSGSHSCLTLRHGKNS